jgi:hypothetical protein
MKRLFLLLVLTCNLSLFAQSETLVGSYLKSFDANNGDKMTWIMTLNSDGTFLYHFYRNFQNGIPSIENFYGKGNWKAEKNLVSFHANQTSDIDETHTLNLNKTKARINSKSPRDKSDREVKTSIIFYESEIQEVKGLELFKE